MKVPVVTVMELIPFKSPLAHVTSDDDEASSDTTQDVYSTMLPSTGVTTTANNNCTVILVSADRSDSRASLTSTANDVCRICHCESEVGAPLISPCICSGSLKYVHQACLQQWIKSADTKSCELCKFNFQMTTKIKPFRKWQTLEMTTVERRKIMCSVTFHIIAITCVIWSLYVLIDRTTQEIKAGILEWPFWTKLIVVAIGFTGGLVFMYVQCKMYVQLCKRWRAYNRVIHIQNCPEKCGMKIPMQSQGNNKIVDPCLLTHSSVLHETELL